MKLQTRMLLAYGYLVTLVLIGAAGAALGFFELSDRIGTVLQENFDSVQASMDMLEALESQDSAVLAVLLEPSHDRKGIESAESSFLEALSRARDNVSEEAERPALDAIASEYEAFRRVRDELLDSPPERPVAAYESRCFPRFEAVKDGVRRLLDLNHRAMVEADRETEQAASRQALGYAVLTAVALLSMGALSRGLRVGLFVRLEELRSVARAVGRGDLRRRAAARATDELDAVARALNGLLDAHEELRGTASARETRLRELLVGRLEADGRPEAVVSLGGDIVASTLGDAETEAVVVAARELKGEIPEDVAAAGPVEREAPVNGVPMRFRLLVVGGRRAVGWAVSAGKQGKTGLT